MNDVPFKAAVAVWFKIGLLSLGEPAGQIALIHRIIVDEKKWLDESRYLHALNYCLLLTRPESQQLATYIGWLKHGVRGGVVAGLFFILPGALAIFLLSVVYVSVGDLAVTKGIFFGLKTTVLAIVTQALIRIGHRALKGTLKTALAVGGFLALFVFSLPFPIVVLAAGVVGYGARKMKTDNVTAFMDANSIETVARHGTGRAALVCAALWVFTVAGLMMFLGRDDEFSQIAVFFSTMATVTFGGAYAVLSYVVQQGV